MRNDSRWLLVKKDNKKADARRDPLSTEPKSVISGEAIVVVYIFN